MRIYGPNGTTLGSSAGNARRTSSTGFALPDTATTAETRSAAPPKAAADGKATDEKPADAKAAEERLALFDAGMKRVDELQAKELKQHQGKRPTREERGWTREDLYNDDRGLPRGFPRGH